MAKERAKLIKIQNRSARNNKYISLDAAREILKKEEEETKDVKNKIRR